MNRKGKWKTLQAGNSEPSNASTQQHLYILLECSGVGDREEKREVEFGHTSIHIYVYLQCLTAPLSPPGVGHVPPVPHLLPWPLSSQPLPQLYWPRSFLY